MKRIKLKKTKKIKTLIVTFILMFIFINACFKYISYRISPIIIEYGSLEAKKLSSIIINKSISKHVTEKITNEDLFEITKDTNGEIKAIDFNSALVNKLLTEITNSVQLNLRNIEMGNIEALEFSDDILMDYNKQKLKKGIIYEFNTGILTKNPLLANLGPKIPIKLTLIGDVISNISTEIKNYGINNALIEVYINLKLTEKIILPFYNQNIKIESKVPVALKIITGSVPDFYVNGLTQTSPSVKNQNN